MKQLGIAAASHSTLFYGNVHRPWRLYQQNFFSLFARIRSKVKRQKTFRFKNILLILDSTIFKLCLRIFNRTRFYWTKREIELHLILDCDGYFPSFANIPEVSIPDNKIIQGFPFDWGIRIVNDLRLRITRGKSS